MNLIDYASILIRRGWIMLLLGIIAAGAAFLFSRQNDAGLPRHPKGAASCPAAATSA